MRRVEVAVLVAAAGLSARIGPATADVVTHDVRGRVDDAGADPRTRALDAAFVSAVSEAVAELVGAIPSEKVVEVDREILARARRFVASFQVQAQASSGGWLEVAVAVRVDHDKLRARLIELGIAVRSTAPPPSPVNRPRAVLLLRVTGAGPTMANFGAASASTMPGLRHITDALDRVGVSVLAAPTHGLVVNGGGVLPTDDHSARAMAREIDAQLALIVGIRVGELGPVRGTPYQAAPADVAMRAIEVATGAVIGEISTSAGAWGRGERIPLDAADAAAVALASVWSLQPAPTRRPSYSAPRFAPRQGISVRVHGDRVWAAATSLKAELAKAAEVKRVFFAGISAEQIVLEVVGSTVANLAAVVRLFGASGGQVAIEGRTIDLALGGSP
jgi:hypothetical protein